MISSDVSRYIFWQNQTVAIATVSSHWGYLLRPEVCNPTFLKTLLPPVVQREDNVFSLSTRWPFKCLFATRSELSSGRLALDWKASLFLNLHSIRKVAVVNKNRVKLTHIISKVFLQLLTIALLIEFNSISKWTLLQIHVNHNRPKAICRADCSGPFHRKSWYCYLNIVIAVIDVFLQ